MPRISQQKQLQNWWLLLTSYFFYGFVDWKMLPILFGITLVFYLIGLWLKDTMNKNHIRRASLITSLGILIGVGFLLYFKYLNFFADSFSSLLNKLGVQATWSTLNIVLPVGVSFFTFKLMSYLIEIHREKIQPTGNFVEFATYIAFFPTILSGPIDRPNTFLPQLRKNHYFNYSKTVDGCRQILWGLFLKMFIADKLAASTSLAWNGFENYSSIQLLYAALLSPIQVYADFDGYSNMAIGVGKVLGFNVTKNFNHPLLARNVAEYWRRWHMSLTSWITDYVFMPLNFHFRNYANWGIFFAITINLVVIGMWHGANWTYAVFGLYHSILFIPLIVSSSFGKNKKIKSGEHGLPKSMDVLKMAFTYLLIAIGHIIFFSKDANSAFSYFKALLDINAYTSLHIGEIGLPHYYYLLLSALIIIEWITRDKEYGLCFVESKVFANRTIRLFLYAILFLLSITLSVEHSAFIYFQF